MHEDRVDVVVVGGGITGAGVALEAAKSGLSVVLLEQRDFCWGTSSRSSKMVHGGLRYVAQGDVRLTRESLHERELLLRELPGLVYRGYYVFPHRRNRFPGPILFGMLLRFYDFLAGISDRQYLDRAATLKRIPGLYTTGLTGASVYTDALTDDSRLVMRVLHEAEKHGAHLHNYMRVESVGHETDGLSVHAVTENGEQRVFHARVVVNATGAFADALRPGNSKVVRPLRGSHLVFRHETLPVNDVLAVMHHRDRRLMFIYPWAGRTVVGTTDLDHRESLLQEPTITADEVDYLLSEVQHQFPNVKVGREDVISTFAGVRPVVSSGKGVNPSAESRTHAVWDDRGLITVTGGKLTTFRVIAHDVLQKATPHLLAAGRHPHKLQGTLFNDSRKAIHEAETAGDAYGTYLVAAYGDGFADLLDAGESMAPIDGTLHCLAELAYALRHEQVVHLDDLLLRRTRLGLLLSEGAAALHDTLRDLCQRHGGWDTARFAAEWERYQALWKAHYSLPGA